MNLSDEVKKRIDSVETIEEKQAILKEAGVELTDDVLDEVSGGIRRNDGKLAQPSGKLLQPNKRLPR